MTESAIRLRSNQEGALTMCNGRLYGLISAVMAVVVIPAAGQETFHSFRTPNFEVRYQPGIPEQDARKVAGYLEKDYTYLSSVLRMNIEKQTEVRIYDTELKFSKGTGDRKSERSASFRRGVLHLKPVAKLEAENRLAQALSMELPMALLEKAIMSGCPQWLAQSFAVYHAGVMPDLSPPVGTKLRYFSDLDQDIQEHPDPPKRQDVEFLLGTTMKFFIESFGEERTFQVFGKFNGTMPIEEVFRSWFGKEFEAIEEAWALHLTAAVGVPPSRSNKND